MNSSLLRGVAVSATVAVLMSGCAADGSGMTETGTGATIGALGGAAAGALIGSMQGDAGKGALVGAAGGALIGTGIGAYMEQQRQDFVKVLGPEIQRGSIRVEKLSDKEILVGMTGETTFETDSAQIKPGFYSTMDKIARVVNKYGKTRLAIAGHTDSTGSAQYNQNLSEDRAASVANYLERDGVAPDRISTAGYGQSRPIASNETEVGRRMNRRVDIIIVPIEGRG